jgi:cytochrome P450
VRPEPYPSAVNRVSYREVADAERLIAETQFPAAATMQCPYPYYTALRSLPPKRLLGGDYAVSRRADILEVTRQPDVFSNHHSAYDDGWMRAATLGDHANPEYAWGLAVSDPPDHTWKRRLAFEMFKPGPLRRQEPMVRGIVDDLIDQFVDRGECEFVAEFANRLTASVILTLFGLPLDHLDRAMSWARYEGFGTRWAAPENQRAARAAIVDVGAFVREHVAERIDAPGNDELSLYVQRYVESRGALDLPNLVADATTLFIGGVITTAHLISSMMVLFLRHPEQLVKAQASRRALKLAVEESLRFESPTQILPRLAVQDGEVGGVAIPAGSIVLLLYGAANRDETVFEAPEMFDIDRANVREHLAFGDRIHFCVGAPRARLEAMVAFERIFARLTNIRLADENADVRNDWTAIFRGPGEVRIRFESSS